MSGLTYSKLTQLFSTLVHGITAYEKLIIFFIFSLSFGLPPTTMDAAIAATTTSSATSSSSTSLGRSPLFPATAPPGVTIAGYSIPTQTIPAFSFAAPTHSMAPSPPPRTSPRLPPGFSHPALQYNATGLFGHRRLLYSDPCVRASSVVCP